MYFELVAGTDSGSVVVFDPAALPELEPLAYDEIIRDLQAGPIVRAMERGDLMLFEPAADGTYKLGFHVGEPAPTGERVETHLTGILRVPSGTLQVGGLEHLPVEDRRNAPSDQRQIPPGTYRLDVYDLEPDEDEPRPKLPYGTLGAFVIPTCLILLLAALFLLLAHRWLWALGAGAAVPVVFRGFNLLYRRARGPELERELLRRQRPGLRLVLTPIDEAAAAGLRGVRLSH